MPYLIQLHFSRLLPGCILLCLILTSGQLQAAINADYEIGYNRDIRSILSENCFSCHGPDEQKAKLRLDRRADALKGGKNGAAIVPGNTQKGLLIERIMHPDPSERMPPEDSHRKLSSDQIALIKRWIHQGAEYQAHWAYVPAVDHPIPKVKRKKWPINWIDHFILSGIEAAKMKPAPDTDKTTLARRLYFDLTGLPPTFDDVNQFVTDKSPDAYEQLVDKLIASPHFGERMAMFWLDLVRFADTVGYHGDQPHSISPYRDWVINAFNSNMSYDRFTRLQLAGDLEPNSTQQDKVASAYNRMLQTSHEGGVQEKEYLAIYAADRIRNFSQVWLGSTIGCAQCHDHKFDPFTDEDFYSLVAFFADIDESQHFKAGNDALPTKRPPEIMVKDKVGGKERECMITVAIAPREIRLLNRGDWMDDSGAIMSPAIPAFMGNLNIKDRLPNRRDLAQWVCSPDNPLTARTFSNRIWNLFFGRGLNKDLGDFGNQGVPTDQLELLDKLSLHFSEQWDMKALVKLIVSSRTYRQSSIVRPQDIKRDLHNDRFARQGRFRLPAEMIRDSSLTISGLLVDTIGGASVMPYQPEGYYKHLNFPVRKYKAHTDEQQWRRGVYVHWQRQFLHPMLKAFDAPSREECTTARAKSNTPLAALTLLNDPNFIETARVFAQRVLTEGGNNDNERLNFCFNAIVSRHASTHELEIMLPYLQSQRDEFTARAGAAELLLKTGQAPLPENVDAPELAAWTAVTRTLFNTNESITRN
jgi:mono/diheme cytochrome c family protein